MHTLGIGATIKDLTVMLTGEEKTRGELFMMFRGASIFTYTRLTQLNGKHD